VNDRREDWFVAAIGNAGSSWPIRRLHIIYSNSEGYAVPLTTKQEEVSGY